MSAAVIQNYVPIEGSNKKLAVRLRLKRTSQQSQIFSQFVPISQTLKHNNVQFSNNNDRLADLQISCLSTNFKNCLEGVSKYFQRQDKVKSNIMSKVIDKFKQQLKYLHKQLENILNHPQLQPTSIQNKSRKQNPKSPTSQPILTATQNSNIEQSVLSSQLDNSRLVQVNRQLKLQISEMQQYIIQLKQLLNEKENILCQYKDQIYDKESQIKSTQERLAQKDNLLAILQEEIVGYQHKIEQLEMQLEVVRKGNRFQSDGQNEEGLSDKQILLNQSKSEDEHSFIVQGKLKENRAIKLQQIYEKTEEALKKYRNLQEQMLSKQDQYAEFYQKICNILAKLNFASREQIQSCSEEQLIQLIEQKLNQRFEKMREEFSERENKLQYMVNMHLDQTLAAIQSQIQHLGQVPSHFTAVDKIQYLREVVQYSLLSATVPQPNTTRQILELFQSKLQQIMNKSQQFKISLTQNNRTLDNLCERFEQLPQSKLQTFQKLNAIEQMLNMNQEALLTQEQEGEQSNMLSSRQNQSNLKTKAYLQELEATIKRIERNQNTSHQVCVQEKQKLRSQIQQLLKFNENLTFKIEQVISELSNLKEDEDIKAIENQLLLINSRLKENTSSLNKDAFSASNSALSQEKFSIELQNLKAKYFQQGSTFIQAMMKKLRQIKQKAGEQKFYEACDSTLKLIQSKDDQMRQQMNRRRELLKQRTAVIAQICKQGMRDSSCQNSIRDSV